MSAARFTFRLARVLALRERKADEAAAAFGASEAKVRQLQSAQEEVLANREAARDELVPRAGTAVRTGDMRAVQLLADQAEARAAWLRAAVAEAEAEAAARRQTLAERVRDRRVLERLRERLGDDWREDADRRARSAMDEVATRLAMATMTNRSK